MPRPRPAGQVDRILDAAEETFARVGLARAKMSTIAEAADLSTATLYHYFESKDALFRWALQRARHPDHPIPETAPLGALEPEEPHRLLRSFLEGAKRHRELHRVIAQPPSRPVIEELRRLLVDLYDRTWQTRRVVDLLEALAVDPPQLRESWHASYRVHTVSAWADYFRSRPSLLSAGDDPEDAASYVLTTCVYFARSRMRTKLRDADHEEYRAAVIDLLVNSFRRAPRRG